jgi:hypothetical protein
MPTAYAQLYESRLLLWLHIALDRGKEYPETSNQNGTII